MQSEHNTSAWRVLLVDDDEGDYFIVREMLSTARRVKFVLEWVSSYNEGLARMIGSDHYDAVLVDYDLGARTGIHLVQEAVSRGFTPPIILLTGHGSYDIDVEAMEAGANDYLSKQDINPALLERSIRYAIDRKRSEMALRASESELRSSEELFRLATRATVGIVYEWNTETGKIFRSDGMKRVLGYDQDEVVGTLDWWIEQIHPEERESVRLHLHEMISGEYETYEAEYRFRHKNGNWVYLWDRSFMERDEQGRVRRVVGVSSDITQRKQLELALEAANLDLARANLSLAQANADLRESEGRFKIALASAPMVVFSQDLDLRYTWMFRSQGQQDSDNVVLGKRDDELLDLKQAEEVMALKRRVLETGEKIRQEISIRLQGKESIFLLVIEPYAGPDGSLRGLIGSALDITELRQLEAWRLEHATQMEVQRRLLEQREMERQQIARDLHDGPIQDLVGLMFSIQAAASMTEEPETREALEEMMESARVLTSALRGVCNELRPPTLMQFGLVRAIQSHAEEFMHRNPGIRIDLDLPAQEGEIGDGARLALFRIFQEGLTNIHKHARANRMNVRLRRSGPDDKNLILEIEDDGCGFIPPRDWLVLAREGHLGLVGMKERCEAVGGHFDVHSRPGMGTLIRVTLPGE